jgi:hypothetical protein
VQCVSPYTTQYYRAILHFACGSVEVNKYSGTDVARVASVVPLCLKKNNSWLDQPMVKIRIQYSQEI